MLMARQSTSRRQQPLFWLSVIALVSIIPPLGMRAESPSYDAERTLAATYTKQNKPKDALQHLNKAIELNPKDAAAYVQRGSLWCFSFNDPERARSDYDRAIALDQNNASIYSSRADFFYHIGQYAEELKDRTKATELAPQNSVMWANKATTELKLHQDDAALADLTKSIDSKPSYNAYWYRAALYKRLGKKDLAMKDLELGEKLPAEGTIRSNFPEGKIAKLSQGESVNDRLPISHGMDNLILEQKYKTLPALDK